MWRLIHRLLKYLERERGGRVHIDRDVTRGVTVCVAWYQIASGACNTTPRHDV